jgi:hypothetical protein
MFYRHNIVFHNPFVPVRAKTKEGKLKGSKQCNPSETALAWRGRQVLLVLHRLQ